MATTKLSRTATTGNREVATFSAWIKKNSNDEQFLFFNSESGTTNFRIRFNPSTDQHLQVESLSGSSVVGSLVTTRKFKDVSSWLHIVVAIDVTLAAADDRMKIYINGVQETSFSSRTNPSLNQNMAFNESGHLQYVGSQDSVNYFNGCMSDLYWIDGTAYAASTFGSTNATSGQWTPTTNPSVSFGVNGFKLTFEDSSNLGDDTSGNTNDLTMSGTGTQTLDCPSNNFAVLENQTYHFTNQWQANTNGGTTANGGSGSAWKTILPTLGDSSGKYYFEAKLISSGSNCIIGAVDIDNQKQNSSSSWYIGQDSTGQGYQNNGTASNGGASYGTSYVNNDIIGVAMDLDNSKIYFSKNGTWQESGDPTSGASGTGALSLTANTTYTFALSSYAGTVWNCNFGNGYFATTAVTSAGTSASTPGTFEYDVPTGYQPLTTKGLNV